MSEYCKWCDTLTDANVQERKLGRLVWTGCPDCFVKKKRLENDAIKK